MPSPRVITERPSEARDAPTFGARFVEKFLAETQIPYTRDVYLLCISRQFVFTWNVITRDVPAIGTYRFSDGWYITGYYIPREDELPGDAEEINVERVGNVSFSQEFLNETRTEGWGIDRKSPRLN